MITHESSTSMTEEADTLESGPPNDHIPKPKAPYLNLLKNNSHQVEHILKLFKQVKVNVPFLDTI